MSIKTHQAGAKIRQFRLRNRMSLASFAALVAEGTAAPLARGTVQGWETGGKIARPAAMARLLELGVCSHADWYAPAEWRTCPASAIKRAG